MNENEQDPGPVLQAFTVKTTGRAAQQKVDRAIHDVLGEGWQATNYGDRKNQFEVTSSESALRPRDAWDRTYQLRAHKGIASAEPLFKAWVTDRPEWGFDGDEEATAAFGLPSFGCGSGQDFAAARDHEWSIDMASVPLAWQNHFAGAQPGEGVVIGHPDTGYRRHPEIAANLQTGSGRDLVDNDDDPEDELKKTFPWQNGGHGTGTASVIVSPRGAADGNPENAVSGTAPHATLIPFRVSDSVVILDTLNLARAIELATDRDVHVISISMGGLSSDRLHDAVVYATSRGVIVLAAAGNCVRFVVFPAAYDEVVAVAACDAELGTWKGSSRGRAVDITAPGDRVWHAAANADDSLDNVSQGSGTSYAVATVAGIAALWLAKHGRNKIINACGGKERIASTFSQLLRDTATPVPGWPSGQFGGGLVNADKLLSAQLPNGRTVPTLAPTATQHVPLARGGLTTFGHLFEGTVRGAQPSLAAAADEPNPLDDGLAELLGTSADKVPADLGQVGQELAFYLATDPKLYRRFEDAVSAGHDDGAVNDVRDQLLKSGVSEALEIKLRR
ncbi:S8 family serine peptidase [Kribbella sp. NPDC058693]|uniref:S8 family peptidase n=1 Tax=Kribbella sp. NPDC058693 TaxID=3346602 RepID=UPI00364E1F5E